MNLSSGQLATLKTHITSNGDTNALYVAGNLAGLADLLNAPASPDYWVWRTRVTKDELVGSVSIDGTTFSWTGAGYITRSQGERDALSTLFDSTGAVNPSIASVRQAFVDIFSGATSPAPENRTHLATVSRRKATRTEKLYAVGSGTTASPSVMAAGAEGTLSYTQLIGL